MNAKIPANVKALLAFPIIFAAMVGLNIGLALAQFAG